MLPGIKIVLYILFIIFLFIVESIGVYAAIFAAIFLLLLRIPASRLKSGLIPISLFLAFTFVSNIINQHGRIVLSYGPLIITAEGFQIAMLRTARLFFMIAGVKILMAFTKTEDIIASLGRLFIPFERLGLPVRDFFHTMGLTMKSFPVLKRMASETYRERMKTENIKSFWDRARMVSLFLLPLFVKSMRSPESFFEQTELNDK